MCLTINILSSKASRPNCYSQDINGVPNDRFSLECCVSITHAIYVAYRELNLTDANIDPLLTLYDLMHSCTIKAPALLGSQYQSHFNSIDHFPRYFPKETSGKYPYAIDMFKACANKDIATTVAILPENQRPCGGGMFLPSIFIGEMLNEADLANPNHDSNKKKFFEMNLQFFRKCCCVCYFNKLEQNLQKKYLSPDESQVEWMHLADIFVVKRDKTAAQDPYDNREDLVHAAKCYEHALNFCMSLHPGNNAVTAEILNDIAVTYHKLTLIKADPLYQSMYKDAENKYEIMMQNIKQGIH